MQSHWVNHSGKDIFLADYRNLSFEVLDKEVSQVVEEICKRPRDSVRLVVDVNRLIISPKELDLFKESALKIKPFVHKTAVLGISGARKVLLDIVVKFSGLQASTFDNIEHAKNWLIQ